ncbi:hypothetical protein [Chromobacterium sp. Beijing]|uniref:hypothetical protein n=1 Tax=Chromobacterium sp. Beijing TaxID=2735795 RepID=UPI001F44A3A8|nr:hypothetical protein [Chromobacterium sp. Beijing]UJB32449.1 hypothetical protein HQN78_16155 [Chromobacterium sp. Beijing]
MKQHIIILIAGLAAGFAQAASTEQPTPAEAEAAFKTQALASFDSKPESTHTLLMRSMVESTLKDLRVTAVNDCQNDEENATLDCEVSYQARKLTGKPVEREQRMRFSRQDGQWRIVPPPKDADDEESGAASAPQ